MNILYIIPYCPVPPMFGGALRTAHVIGQAARRHQVTILTIGWPGDDRKLQNYFHLPPENVRVVPRHWTRRHRRAAQGFSLLTRHSFFHMLASNARMQRVIAEVLRERKFDIIQVEFSPMGQYTLDADAVKILDSHNVEYDNFRRMWLKNRSFLKRIHYRFEYKKFYREEIESCSKFDLMFVTSSRDKEILDGDVPAVPKIVVPNGVDSSYFTATGEPFEPHSIVFTGAMSYLPNHDGIHYFMEEVFPLIEQVHPDARVYIVGSKPPPAITRLARKNVVVTGFVEDVRPFVRKSSVYVVPLRMGSGTRLKILEALSMKIPIVTTSIGCEGINVRNDETAMIADSPRQFADAVIDLFDNADRRKRLVSNGYDLVTSTYTWDVIGEQIDGLYRDAVAGRYGKKKPAGAGR
ncbi:MAG TPA: glycosyltransferase family 4 protein [Bacteroidota bacterium]|nr:glycosyltransferase family 4 protein [Bacteroidota bacterium]